MRTNKKVDIKRSIIVYPSLNCIYIVPFYFLNDCSLPVSMIKSYLSWKNEFFRIWKIFESIAKLIVSIKCVKYQKFTMIREKDVK